MYTIHLAKEPFKFSCSHFTILAHDRAERLHGHNYQVRVSIRVQGIDDRLGLAFDFNSVKPMIRTLCESLDERILLPENSPFLKLKKREKQIEAQFNERFYSFPQSDTLILPLLNISSEELARHLAEQLREKMQDLPFWTALKVNIEETRGQSVSFSIKR